MAKVGLFLIGLEENGENLMIGGKTCNPRVLKEDAKLTLSAMTTREISRPLFGGILI